MPKARRITNTGASELLGHRGKHPTSTFGVDRFLSWIYGWRVCGLCPLARSAKNFWPLARSARISATALCPSRLFLARYPLAPSLQGHRQRFAAGAFLLDYTKRRAHRKRSRRGVQSQNEHQPHAKDLLLFGQRRGLTEHHCEPNLRMSFLSSEASFVRAP